MAHRALDVPEPLARARRPQLVPVPTCAIPQNLHIDEGLRTPPKALWNFFPRRMLLLKRRRDT